MRPFVHINFAVDQRGSYCCSEGKPLSISCETDWQRVHDLRERYDAVAVGGRTWKLDCPSLSVRAERLGRQPNRQPARVVFAGEDCCEATGPGAGVATHVIASSGRNLAGPLDRIWRLGIRSLLVEGGPTLLSSFLLQDCFDRITVFVRGSTVETAMAGATAPLPSLPRHMEAAPFGQGCLLAYRRGHETAVRYRAAFQDAT